jgi:hypothetical protein
MMPLAMVYPRSTHKGVSISLELRAQDFNNQSTDDLVSSILFPHQVLAYTFLADMARTNHCSASNQFERHDEDFPMQSALLWRRL